MIPSRINSWINRYPTCKSRPFILLTSTTYIPQTGRPVLPNQQQQSPHGSHVTELGMNRTSSMPTSPLLDKGLYFDLETPCYLFLFPNKKTETNQELRFFLFPLLSFSSQVGHSRPTGKPLPCPKKWTARIMTSRESNLGGGLTNKKAESYYWRNWWYSCGGFKFSSTPFFV